MRTVAVNHPAPLLCVHRTPGQARVDFVQAVTPVRLREEDPAAFVPAAEMSRSWGGPLPLFLHDGSLWADVGIDAAAFVGHLETARTGGYDPDRWALRGFARSPLSAYWENGPARGDPAGARKVRKVLADGTERARADLARFLDRNVRIVGDGTVLRRCAGPLAVHAGSHMTPAFAADLGDFRFSTGSGMLVSPHIVTPRADRLDEFWAFEVAFYAEHHPGKVSERASARPVSLDARGLDRHLGLGTPFDDVLAYAWDAPGIALRNLSAEDLAVRGVADAAARAAPFMALGLVGSTRSDEAEAAIAATCALIEAAPYAQHPEGTAIGLRKLAAYGRAVAIPRLRGALTATPDEDAAALGAFAP